jgi:hypothetical protein
VPDLRDAIESPVRFAAAAGDAAAGADVVVGHSGASPFLPGIAARAGARVVFVDAALPGEETSTAPSPGLIALLDRLAVVDGRLPPWHEWWTAGRMAELVPDDALRAAIIAEVPCVSRAFYDEPVALPSRWWTRPAGYLQLSPPYDDDCARAQEWGWPVRRLDGRHLDLAVHPDRVAAEVVALALAAPV